LERGGLDAGFCFRIAYDENISSLTPAMKLLFFAAICLFCSSAVADTPDVAIPESTRSLIKSTDFVEVKGTNDRGGQEDFTIHNDKAIRQFIGFLTSKRFTTAPKDLKPQFKSLSAYKVRLSSKGVLLLEFQVIADSVLDLPEETVFYVESDRHSDNLMAPLLRLR
jgi:hypothetical protein